MSRGPGKLMAYIQHRATDEWVALIDIAGSFEKKSVHSARESCRQAIGRLAAMGLIEVGYEPMTSRGYPRLVVRRAQTPIFAAAATARPKGNVRPAATRNKSAV